MELQHNIIETIHADDIHQILSMLAASDDELYIAPEELEKHKTEFNEEYFTDNSYDTQDSEYQLAELLYLASDGFEISEDNQAINDLPSLEISEPLSSSNTYSDGIVIFSSGSGFTSSKLFNDYFENIVQRADPLDNSILSFLEESDSFISLGSQEREIGNRDRFEENVIDKNTNIDGIGTTISDVVSLNSNGSDSDLGGIGTPDIGGGIGGGLGAGGLGGGIFGGGGGGAFII